MSTKDWYKTNRIYENGDILITRWDDMPIPVELRSKDNETWEKVPTNLTWWVLSLTVKKFEDLNKVNDDDAVLKVEITSFDNPTSWNQEISITNQDSNILPWKYYYDIQFKAIDWTISTPIKALFIVTQDATKNPQLAP